MIECNDMYVLISAYIDGETTPEETELVREHLAVCEDCSRIYRDLRGVAEAVSSLAERTPEDFARQVASAAEEKKISRFGRLVKFYKIPSAAAAAVILAAALSLYMSGAFSQKNGFDSVAESTVEESTVLCDLSDEYHNSADDNNATAESEPDKNAAGSLNGASGESVSIDTAPSVTNTENATNEITTKSYSVNPSKTTRSTHKATIKATTKATTTTAPLQTTGATAPAAYSVPAFMPENDFAFRAAIYTDTIPDFLNGLSFSDGGDVCSRYYIVPLSLIKPLREYTSAPAVIIETDGVAGKIIPGYDVGLIMICKPE